MSAVDFEQWATPDLEIKLGGRTFRVPPPSVEAAKQVVAAAVRGEVHLGLVQAEIPAEVASVLATIEPGEHPALGPVYAEMQAAGIAKTTLDRIAYYAVFYWARGKAYADSLATILWTPREQGDPPAGDADPKGSSSPRRTGRPTA